MKTYYHIIFWVAVIFLLSLIFGGSFDSTRESLYFISMLLPIMAGTFYYLNYYLIPRFLLTRKYWRFALYFIYTLIVSIYLETIVMMFSFIFLANYNLGVMKPYAGDVTILAMVMYVIILFGSFLFVLFQLQEKQQKISLLNKEKELKERAYLDVRSDRKNVRIEHDLIIYIESLADYVKINIELGKPLITREKISKVEKRLPDNFLRIHRSFIVNTNKITSFNYDAVIIGEQELPVSRSYKKVVMDILNKS